MLQDYTEFLSTARRKAQLSGRPLTEQETAGISRGYASKAGERLFKAKRLSLAERGLDIQEKSLDEQLKAAEEARKSERGEAIGTLAGMGLGYALGPAGSYAGMIIGGAIGGYVGGSTWLCTETNKQSGLDINVVQLLNKFRDYCIKYHKAWYEFYVRIGPEIVRGIAENEFDGKDIAGFYDNLKSEMIIPVTELTAKNQTEKAFELYIKFVKQFIVKYTPRHEMEAEAVDKVDKAFYKEAA